MYLEENKLGLPYNKTCAKLQLDTLTLQLSCQNPIQKIQKQISLIVTYFVSGHVKQKYYSFAFFNRGNAITRQGKVCIVICKTRSQFLRKIYSISQTMPSQGVVTAPSKKFANTLLCSKFFKYFEFQAAMIYMYKQRQEATNYLLQQNTQIAIKYIFCISR